MGLFNMFRARPEETPAPVTETRETAEERESQCALILDVLKEGVSLTQSSLHRFARELGLTKSRQHMRKQQRNAADKAKASHLRNGTYPPKGYIIPRSEEFRFKAGVTSVERLGKRKERQRIERSAESRRKTFREEKARALFGVPRKTRLRVVKEPRGKTYQR